MSLVPICCYVYVVAFDRFSRRGIGGAEAPTGRDRGQATTEYALVMLGAALVALLVVAWATAGGGAGKIGQLFDRVLDAVLQNVT